MNNKKVIVNVRSDSPIQILESRTEGSDLYLVGEFTTFDVMNRNKRIYKKDNYKTVLAPIAEKCASGALLGELGHPNGRSNTEFDQVSHIVTKLEIDEEKNCVIGELKILPTPKGDIARTLIENNVPLYVSSRASGYIGKDGVVTLTSLITYDLVDDPGFANARLTVRDITESLCDECEDAECVAIFEPELSSNTQTAATAAPAPSSDPIVIDAINKLTSEVKALSDRVTSCETKLASCNNTVSVSKANVQTIVDSCVKESMEKIYDKIYKLDEQRISENSSLNNQNDNIIKYLDYLVEECNKREKYMDYIAEECNKREKYMDYVVEECNKREKYMDYIAEECDKREKYMDYVVESINENGVTSDDHRFDVIESYLEQIGLAFNKNEKAINEKFDKFIEYTDYIANTINENNDEVRMFQQYIDEELVPTIENTINENKAFKNEIVANVHDLNKINKNVTALDTRVKLFTESVGDKLDAVKTINDTSEMNDVKKLLENIQARENAEKKNIQEKENAKKENAYLLSEESRLLSFMHPSVRHIWESFDNATKMKIVNDMSVSKCLAVQTQSLILTRMINNQNTK